jgi:hypothetical protein
MIERLRDRHPFAALALQWMVPEPLFEIRHVTLPTDVVLPRNQRVSLVTEKLEIGVTPDPSDRAHWRTYEAQVGQDAEGMASHRGQPDRRGPHLIIQKSNDPRLCTKVDLLQEWRDYFASGRKFTLGTPWRDSPPQFKREFCFLWRHLDSRAVNPFTETRTDVPREHETKFFNGWRLTPALLHETNEREDWVRAIMFDELADHYRVFAFPKSIRSRMEARRMGKWLAEQLWHLPEGGELPAHEPEIYGTPLQWDVFLFAGKCDDESLLDAYRQAKPQIQPIERQRRWRKERLNYIEHFRAIEHAVELIFPVNTLPPRF